MATISICRSCFQVGRSGFRRFCRVQNYNFCISQDCCIGIEVATRRCILKWTHRPDSCVRDVHRHTNRDLDTMRSSEVTTVSRSVLSGRPDRLQSTTSRRDPFPSRKKGMVIHSIRSRGGSLYVLRLIRRRPSTASYTWTVVRDQDSGEVARSRKAFATLMEALADAALVVAPLALYGIEPDAMGSASC